MSQSDSPVISGSLDQLRTLAQAHFGDSDPRPLWVWGSEGTRLLWANSEGLAALNVQLENLDEVVPTAPAKRSLQAVARTQASAGDRGRIEILRISAGSHQETLVATCRRIMLGETPVVVAQGSKSSTRRAPSVPVIDMQPVLPEAQVSDDGGPELGVQSATTFAAEAASSAPSADGVAGQAASERDAEFAFKPRSRPHRFSFIVEANGTISELSSGLSDAVGARTALEDGALASEALAARLDDVPPAVFHGVDERHRFSEHEVFWPVSGSDLVIPVRLSGFDEDDDRLRVFGTALTGKAQQRAPVAAEAAPQASRQVEALSVEPLSESTAATAGLYSDTPAALTLDEPTNTTTVQVPGAAALAAATTALTSGLAAGMARTITPASTFASAPELPQSVAARDDALEEDEARTAGLWSDTPVQPTAVGVAALDDKLESDEAERAGLWTSAPRADMPVETDTPAPDDVIQPSVSVPNAPVAGDDQAEPDFPSETLDAMKAVASGIAAGLTGTVVGGVVQNVSQNDGTADSKDTPQNDDEDDDLSRPERLTFQEIARRLGARITEQSGGAQSNEGQGDDLSVREPDQSHPHGDVVRFGHGSSTPSEDEPTATTDSIGASWETIGAGATTAGLLAGRAESSGDRESQDDTAGSARVLPFTRTEPNAERMVLDRLPLGILIHSDEAILYANRAALEMTGRPNLQALEALEGIEALFANGLQTDSANSDVDGHSAMTLLRPDGSHLPVTGRLQSVRWDGQSAALLSLREHTSEDTANEEASQDASLLAAGAATATPIAGANAADGALPLVRARIGELEAIIDLASDGVVTLDGEGEITDLNQAAQALVGYAADDLIGRPFRLLFPEDSRQTALDYLDDMTKQGRLSLFNEGRELECITAQGGLVPVFVTLGRLTDDEPAVYCAVLRDLSPFKQAETDLVEARKAAEEASAHKSDFLARVSHEIRTPLNAVIGFSEVMLEERFGPVGSERYRQYLRDIHTSGEHLMSLLNDLLDLSKIEAGKMELTFTEVDLNDVVQQCLAIMQPQANQGRIIVRTSLPLSLPKVVADIRSVRQVALNLMSNAIKFTDPGGQIIVSTLYEPSGEVSLRVRDTGRGMDAADVELALQPFRQVPTTLNQVITGTGLGLPLTKALVEANRAQFGLESTPGEGTLAMMIFPSQRVLAE